MHVIGSLSRLAAALASFIIRVKYTFQPSMPKFDFQHSTMKPVKKHPPTIKTGQIWSSAGFKSGFLFSGDAEILYYFFEHLNVLK